MASSSSVSTHFFPRALNQLLGLWQSRNPNERLLIGIASALILLAMTVTLVDWLSKERKRLARTLPRLEIQMAAMDAAAQEMAALRLQPAAKGASSSFQRSAEAARARVTEQGLNLAVTEASEALGIRGTAPFDRSIQLLGTLHKENGLRVQKAEISRQENGQASVDIVLVVAVTH